MIAAVALACAAVVASLWASPGVGGLFGAGLACLMIAIAVSDWRRYRVPDRLNAAALTLCALDILIWPQAPRAEAAIDAATRALVMFGAFYLFRWLYERLRGREGIGLGDVKLAGVAGAWVGWALLPWVVEAAAVFGLALAFARRRRPGAAVRLPFAVGFAPAIWLGWWAESLGLLG